MLYNIISDGVSYRKYSETPLTKLVTTLLSPEDHCFLNVYQCITVTLLEDQVDKRSQRLVSNHRKRIKDCICKYKNRIGRKEEDTNKKPEE